MLPPPLYALWFDFFFLAVKEEITIGLFFVFFLFFFFFVTSVPSPLGIHLEVCTWSLCLTGLRVSWAGIQQNPNQLT